MRALAEVRAPTRELEMSAWNLETATWRIMGLSKYGYKSPNWGYNYSYLSYNPTYSVP